MKHGDLSQLGSSDEHYTPSWIFDALGLTFDLDVASGNSDSIQVPAKRKYTIEDDGLIQPWHGLIWMNPPFSKPSPWADKFIEHGNGIALMPCTRGKWWYRLWEADTHVLPLPHNLKFNRHELPSKPVTFNTFLFAMGDISKEALKNMEGRIR